MLAGSSSSSSVSSTWKTEASEEDGLLGGALAVDTVPLGAGDVGVAERMGIAAAAVDGLAAWLNRVESWIFLTSLVTPIMNAVGRGQKGRPATRSGGAA